MICCVSKYPITKRVRNLANQNRIQISLQTCGISEQAFGSRCADCLYRGLWTVCDAGYHFATLPPGKLKIDVMFFYSIGRQGEHCHVGFPLRPCYTRQLFLQLFVARQVARKISRVTPQFCNLQRQQNVALRVTRKVEISCVQHIH